MKCLSAFFAEFSERMPALSPVATILTFAFLFGLTAPTSAAVKIDGVANSLSVSAEAASVNDVLFALSVRYNLTYESSPEFNRPIGGYYSGTLQEVLKAVLHECSYILEVSPDGIALKALQRSGDAVQSNQHHYPVASAKNLALPPQLLGQGPFR